MVLTKNSLNAERIQIRERALVEQCWFHRPTLSEMVDDHVHEFQLVGRQCLVLKKGDEGLLSSFSIETDERTDEESTRQYVRS